MWTCFLYIIWGLRTQHFCCCCCCFAHLSCCTNGIRCVCVCVLNMSGIWPWTTPYSYELTFPPPVGLGGKSNVSAIFAVKFCHQCFVRVSYHDDAWIKGFNLLLAALVCLNTNCPPTPPVVSLAFKTWEMMTDNNKRIYSPRWKRCVFHLAT